MEPTVRASLKVCRADSRGKILDFSDLDRFPKIYDLDGDDRFAPKLALNYRRYDTETHKSEMSHSHFIDVDVLHLLCWDILNFREGVLLDEYKGSLADSAGVTKFAEKRLISRRLTVEYKPDLRIGAAYQFSFIAVDGVEGDKGQVKPQPGGEVYVKEFIYLGVEPARKVALRLSTYLQAKEAAAFVALL